jgi:integrase
MKLEKIKAKGINNLFRNADSQIIYFRKYIKGREITKSTGTKKLEEARAFVEDFLGQSKKPKKALRSTALELFDVWIEGKKTLGARPNTVTSLLATRRCVEPFFATMFIEEVTGDWWSGIYIPTMRERVGAGRKFFNDRKWLNAFLRHLHLEGKLLKRPLLGNPDKKNVGGRVFADDEVDDLLNLAQNPDLHLAILMAVTMGMRRNEIFALRVERVNRQRQTILLTEDDTKTKKAREFKVSPDVWPLLEKRLSSGSPWVFPRKNDPSQPLHKDGFKTAWTNLRKMCGVDGRFHDLRHTFLTKAFKAPGANPALICHYAGLSLEVAEKVYLHFTPEDTLSVASLVSFVRGNSTNFGGEL